MQSECAQQEVACEPRCQGESSDTKSREPLRRPGRSQANQGKEEDSEGAEQESLESGATTSITTRHRQGIGCSVRQ